MNIFSPFNCFFRCTYNRLLDSYNRSQQLQEELFFFLIDKGSKTLFGFDHNFKKIKSIDDFNKYVPISTYEQILPYIDTMMRGEQNVLWPTKIKFFAQSFGTTNLKNKNIPITLESFKKNHYKAEKDMLAIYLHNNPQSEILNGKNISIFGVKNENKKNFDIDCGKFTSAFWNDYSAWPKTITSTEEKILQQNNIEEKLKIYFNEDIRSISGTPELVLTFFRTVLEKKNTEYIQDVWPNFEVFFYSGMSFSPYRKSFKKLLQRPIKIQEQYNAAEGLFAIQLSPEDDDMLLLLNHGIFYEFVEFDDFAKNNFTNVKTIKDVEIGKIYALIITTCSGLWRYAIGDTIEFTCLNPCKIKIVGRTKLFINTFGEELTLQNAEEALAFACEKTDSAIANYTAGPKHFIDNLHGCHEWAIEFSKVPQDLDVFVNILDEKLKSLNAEYNAKRYKDIVLGCPILIVLPEDFFSRWEKTHYKFRGQYKTPRLYNSRIYLDDIHRCL